VDERVGVQVKLWDPLRTCAIPERFWGGVVRRGAISSVRSFTFFSVNECSRFVATLTSYKSIQVIRQPEEPTAQPLTERYRDCLWNLDVFFSCSYVLWFDRYLSQPALTLFSENFWGFWDKICGYGWGLGILYNAAGICHKSSMQLDSQAAADVAVLSAVCQRAPAGVSRPPESAVNVSALITLTSCRWRHQDGSRKTNTKTETLIVQTDGWTADLARPAKWYVTTCSRLQWTRILPTYQLVCGSWFDNAWSIYHLPPVKYVSGMVWYTRV